MSTADQSDFSERIERLKEVVKATLIEWEPPFRNSTLLNRLPDDCFDNIPDGFPHTVHLAFSAPEQPKKEYTQANFGGIIKEIFGTEPLGAAASDQIDTVIQQEIDNLFSPGSPAWSASRQFGDVTVTMTADHDAALAEAAHNVERLGLYVPFDELDHYSAPQNFMSVNGISLISSNRGYDRDSLIRHFLPQVVALAEGHKKVQQKTQHSLSDYVCYLPNPSPHSPLSFIERLPETTPEQTGPEEIEPEKNVVRFGNAYLEHAKNKPLSYSETWILHEFGHTRTYPLAKQALDTLNARRNAAVVHMLRRAGNPHDAADRMASELCDVYKDITVVRQKLAELDQCYAQLTPFFQASIGHIDALAMPVSEKEAQGSLEPEIFRKRTAAAYSTDPTKAFFLKFGDMRREDSRIIDGRKVADDIMGNNFYTRHVIGIPSPSEADIQALETIASIYDDMRNEKLAVISACSLPERGEASTEARALLEKHPMLGSYIVALDQCIMPLDHAIEFLADDTAVDLADDPHSRAASLRDFSYAPESYSHPSGWARVVSAERRAERETQTRAARADGLPGGRGR